MVRSVSVRRRHSSGGSSGKRDRERCLAEQLESMRAEAEEFLRRLGEGTFPDVAVNIILQRMEIPVLSEDSRLFEARAYRVCVGGGTRIRGVYIGGGTSESPHQLREIDPGTLVLTTQRLIFDLYSCDAGVPHVHG